MANGTSIGAELKLRNRNSVYKLVYKEGCLPKQALVTKLGLSLPTVTQNLTSLMESGLVVEKGSFGNTGGRRARGYAVVPEARYAVGVDINKNHYSVVVVNLLGTILYSKREYTHFSNSEDYYRLVSSAVEAAILQCSIPDNRLLGVGVALQGIVSADHKTVSYGEILGITGVSKDKICGFIKYPSALFHDSDMAAFAELWNVPEADEMVYVSLSTNLGGAIINPISAFREDHFGKARIEHMTLYPGGKRCYCGQFGCADSYCSASVLMEATDNNRLESFFEQLHSGNGQIQQVWNRYLDDLAVVINNTRMMHDCDIVLGGYMGEYLDEYLDDLKKRTYCRNSFDKKDDYLKLCRVKTEPMAVGAALHYINSFINAV